MSVANVFGTLLRRPTSALSDANAAHPEASLTLASISAGSAGRRPARPPAPSSVRALIVEDSPELRDDVCAMLSRWGIEPLIASDGAQALALVDRLEFDIIFMDISMPVMDGLEATARIRAHELDDPRRRRVPIVAHSSGALLRDDALMRRIGFDDVLIKPCLAQTMAMCLRRWCPTKFASLSGSEELDPISQFADI